MGGEFATVYGDYEISYGHERGLRVRGEDGDAAGGEGLDGETEGRVRGGVGGVVYFVGCH